MDTNLKDLLGNPFERDSVPDRIRPGSICIAAIPYVHNDIYVIRPEDVDPGNLTPNKYIISAIKPQLLSKETNGLGNIPHKELNLRSNEDLVVTKIKHRPVVVLTKPIRTEAGEISRKVASCVLCAPFFTIVDELGHPKFSKNIIENILALKYRSVFPVPPLPTYQNRIGLIRFDRIQAICPSLIKPIEYRFTKTWLLYIREWIKYFGTGVLGSRETDPAKETPGKLLSEARTLLLYELERSRT